MMNRIFSVLFLVAAIGMATASPLRAEEAVIRISADPWEPWVLGSEGSVASGGSAVTVAQEVFRRLGLETQTMIYPYERCIHQMQYGESDVLLMVKKSPEREAFMLFSDVVVTDPQLIYYAPQHLANFSWNRWEDLLPYTVGGVQGFKYGAFDAAAKDLHIKTEMTASEEQNILKLLNGRVDLIILNRATANHYVQKNPQVRGKMIAASKIISNAEFHLALSKKGRAVALLPRINAALQAMKADGALEEMSGVSE